MNRLAILLIGLAIVGFASGNWRRKETFMEWLKRREPDRPFISNEGKTWYNFQADFRFYALSIFWSAISCLSVNLLPTKDNSFITVVLVCDLRSFYSLLPLLCFILSLRYLVLAALIPAFTSFFAFLYCCQWWLCFSACFVRNNAGKN